MKKYLITGCAGFIGSNFVYYIVEVLLALLIKRIYERRN